ncbi:MAG: hypothetical protein MJ062_08475 [Oscillospiraceae bacterium]|nr:hypothetical protein [Oscillospiraceae bacterium]
MKKMFVIVPAAAMLLSLAACGKTPSSDQEVTTVPTSAAETTQPASAENQLGNPWTEVSADDIYNYLGYRFGIPEGAEEICYFWNETNGIAEMQFKNAQGYSLTARAKKTDALEDISGMYYDFGDNTDNYGYGPDCFIRNNDQELRGDYYLYGQEGEYAELGVWFYEGSADSYSFSLSTVNDTDFIDISQDAGEVFILEAADDAANEAEQYSMEYWEAAYPGENVCPFYIEIDGVQYSYYRVSGLDESTMRTWIDTPLNWNGWHLVGDDIVNGDETFRMTDDWAGEEPEQSFSSCCVVTTERYDPSAVAETTAPAAETSAEETASADE